MDPLDHGHIVGLITCGIAAALLLLFGGFKLAELIEERFG